jgi:hypothetical protein
MQPFLRLLSVVAFAVSALLISNPVIAGDAVAECKAFFQKFEKCVDGLKPEQQDEARIFMKTLRGTLGMSDDLNQGDPMMLGIMCGTMIDEVKKEPMVQKYNCSW